MVIIDRQIAERVDRDNLIESFDKNCLTNIGYDLRAKKFFVGSSGEERVTLLPNESAFVESVEIITMPKDLLGRVALKNSRIRLGLSLDAPLYQPGHKTRIYFRVTNVSADSITLYSGEKYAMIVFEQLKGEPDYPYEGVFRDEFDYRGLGDYKDVYKHQHRELEKKADDIKSMESSIYTNVLAILAIFMALFSFLSINVTLAANSATMGQYLIFNALLLGGISFLVALLSTILKPRRINLLFWGSAVVFFAAALIIYF